MVNNDWTQRVRLKPYERDRATRKERTDKVDLSMYKIPITGSESKLIWPSTINFFHQKLCAGNAAERSSNVATPTSATAGATQNRQERTCNLTNY